MAAAASWRALAIRARRATDNYEKDDAKARDVAVFATALDDLLAALSPNTTGARRLAIEEFFWLLEEYKVSVFAQELKTAVPTSRKRLRRALEEIQRMQ